MVLTAAFTPNWCKTAPLKIANRFTPGAKIPAPEQQAGSRSNPNRQPRAVHVHSDSRLGGAGIERHGGRRQRENNQKESWVHGSDFHMSFDAVRCGFILPEAFSLPSSGLQVAIATKSFSSCQPIKILRVGFGFSNWTDGANKSGPRTQHFRVNPAIAGAVDLLKKNAEEVRTDAHAGLIHLD